MKTTRIVFIVAVVGVLISVGVMGFTIFWGPERIEISGQSLPQLVENGGLLALIAIPLALIISGGAILSFARILFPPEIKNGVTAQARVLKVWDTGVSINDNPQVGLLLEVSPEGDSPFQVEAKTVVSRLNVALVQPGVMAEVKYDPHKRQRLRVLTIHSQGAASGGVAARLEELDGLRDKGLITEEEYQQKRQEILQAL